ILSEFFTHILFHSPTHPYLYFCTGHDPDLRNFIGYLYEEYNAGRQYKNRMLGNLVMAFFILLLRKHSADVIIPSIKQEDNPDLVYILKYIQEHYRTVTMKELSSFFNYSERHLQRLIQKGTGMSFHESITRLKMRRAKEMLAVPDISVSIIAEELGYSDIGGFRAAFKKASGKTPQEYRAEIGRKTQQK
ncbi:MAG: AraC family transcriptional regulator, partial [Lachnospiraceae bacterium]|nr:AraC family transcriptional regulator [Lachnospiraceae bacterium]